VKRHDDNPYAAHCGELRCSHWPVISAAAALLSSGTSAAASPAAAMRRPVVLCRWRPRPGKPPPPGCPDSSPAVRGTTDGQPAVAAAAAAGGLEGNQGRDRVGAQLSQPTAFKPVPPARVRSARTAST